MRLSFAILVLAVALAVGVPRVEAANTGQAERSVAQLDGAWTVTVTCNSQSAVLPPFVVSGGHSAGQWGAGKMVFSYNIGVSPGGAVSGSASGPNVHGQISGNVTDWNHGAASGTFDVHGRAPGQAAAGKELSCAGTWQAEKTN